MKKLSKLQTHKGYMFWNSLSQNIFNKINLKKDKGIKIEMVPMYGIWERQKKHGETDNIMKNEMTARIEKKNLKNFFLRVSRGLRMKRAIVIIK